RTKAENLADAAQKVYDTPAATKPDTPPPAVPPAPSLIALWTKLKQPEKAKKLQGELADDSPEMVFAKDPVDFNAARTKLRDLQSKGSVSPWVVMHLADTWHGDEARDLVGDKKDAALQGRIQLELLRESLHDAKQAPDQSQADQV